MNVGLLGGVCRLARRMGAGAAGEGIPLCPLRELALPGPPLRWWWSQSLWSTCPHDWVPGREVLSSHHLPSSRQGGAVLCPTGTVFTEFATSEGQLRV